MPHLLFALLLIATFILSTGLSLYLTPRIRKAAIRFNVLDAPDNHLKKQTAPVPYLGGISIYITFVVTLCLMFEFEPRLMGLLLGGTLIAMLGLFDDLRVLPPGIKFFAQLLATWVAVKSGIRIELAILPEWADLTLTFLWLIALTNAFNLIDVADGLCSGTAIVALMAFFANALWVGDPLIATTALTLTGAVLGFLRSNWCPAKIYLGDTGSMFIGFMTGALAMIGKYPAAHEWGVLAPLCILSVPLFDTLFISLARLAKGRSPFMGSPDHFALRLRHHGWSTPNVALVGMAATLIGTGVAFFLVYLSEPSALIVLAGWSVALLVAFFLLWRIPATNT